jgi:transcriptional regulator with XRE-family HTH domain
MSASSNSIGSLIHRFRAINDITQEELAEKLQLPVQTIMKYESGQAEPPFEIIKKLHKILNIPLEIIFEESDSVHNHVNRMEDKLIKHIRSIELLEKNPDIEKIMKEFAKNPAEHSEDKTLKLLAKIIKLPKNKRKKKYALINKLLSAK